MRKVIVGVALAMLLAVPGMAGRDGAQTAEERKKDAAAIRAHIDSIFQAYIAKDRDEIRATHAEDWRGFLRPSRSVIKGIEGYMEAAEAALSGPYGLSAYEFVEYDVVFYGDTGVVNYVAELVPGRGTRRPRIRVLDVYRQIGGEWIQVASQTAPHPDSLAAQRQRPAPVSEALRAEILNAREQLWQSWFGNREDLVQVVPAETIAINPDQEEWEGQKEILAAAAAFVARGSRLLGVEFPRTEIQLYGDVAILYSLYRLELEIEGQTVNPAGRATEVFVRREGRWVNPGWHLDSGK
jgi:ketosteroid isomerase-like protein